MPGLSEKSWGRSSWGSQPVGDVRRQRMRPDVMSGIVATEGSFWRSTCVMHLIVWEGIHFYKWLVSEHLTSTISCGRLIPLQPDYSLARRGLPQRQVSSRETQLDPHSLLYRLMKQPEVSSLNLMYGIWTMLPSETPRRGFTTIYWYYWRGSEQLAWRSMETNVSSPFSMTACRRLCSEGSFRGLGWLMRVTFHCSEPRWIYKAFQGQSIRKGKRFRGWHQSWRCWTHITHLFCWRMPLRFECCNMYWDHHPLT